MTKLKIFYLCALCHTTDINTIVSVCPKRPEYILVNTCNSCCDVKGPDVVLTARKNAWKKFSIFPLRYYANCVSTTLTVLILHNFESVCFFYGNPVYKTQYWGAFEQPLLSWKCNKCYIFWVFVCSLRYPACNAHAPYCHLWSAPL
jgi:hypothetical protein